MNAKKKRMMVNAMLIFLEIVSVMWGQKILTNIKDVSQLNATSRP